MLQLNDLCYTENDIGALIVKIVPIASLLIVLCLSLLCLQLIFFFLGDNNHVPQCYIWQQFTACNSYRGKHEVLSSSLVLVNTYEYMALKAATWHRQEY
jgi:hypothetical protein